MFGPIEKASMVGFTLLSRSYYYLRRRSIDEVPAPRARPTTVRQGNEGLLMLLHIVTVLSNVQNMSKSQRYAARYAQYLLNIFTI